MKIRISLIILALLFISSCKAFDIPSHSMPREGTADFAVGGTSPAIAPKMAMSRGGSFKVNRKIEKTAALSIEVKYVESARKSIDKIVDENKGLIEDSNTYEDDAGRKRMELRIRVPAQKLGNALGALKKIGHVREESISGDDVTEQYFDLETRLSNSKKLEKRMLDLLDTESKELKDVLEVEKELARVREKIERMEGQKRRMNDRIDLATINLRIMEPLGWGRGIFYPLKGLLHRALGTFTASIAALIVVISAAVPWIAVIVVTFWLTLLGLRFWIHRKREAKEKKQKAQHIE